MKKTAIAVVAGLVLSAGLIAAPAEAHSCHSWRAAINRFLGYTPYNTYNPYAVNPYGISYGAYNPYVSNPYLSNPYLSNPYLSSNYNPYVNPYGGGVINTLLRAL